MWEATPSPKMGGMSASVIPSVSPPTAVRFRLLPATLYFAGVLLVTVLVGFVAAQIAHVRAPWLVFPLAVGAVLGFLAGKFAELVSFGHRPTILFVAAFAGIAVVGTMHYLEFRAYLAAPRSAQFELIAKAFPDVAESHPGAAPAGFWDFLGRMAIAGRAMPLGWTAKGAWAWASWALDALLVVSGAMFITLVFLRRPYCGVCRGYYRVVRQELLRPEQYVALAQALGWSDRSAGTAIYEHLGCRGGCGPDRVRIGTGRGAPRLAWIARADRARLFQLLDQSA